MKFYLHLFNVLLLFKYQSVGFIECFYALIVLLYSRFQTKQQLCSQTHPLAIAGKFAAPGGEPSEREGEAKKQKRMRSGKEVTRRERGELQRGRRQRTTARENKRSQQLEQQR